MNVPQEIGTGVVSAWGYVALATATTGLLRRLENDDDVSDNVFGMIWPVFLPIILGIYGVLGFKKIGMTKILWGKIYEISRGSSNRRQP